MAPVADTRMMPTQIIVSGSEPIIAKYAPRRANNAMIPTNNAAPIEFISLSNARGDLESRGFVK